MNFNSRYAGEMVDGAKARVIRWKPTYKVVPLHQMSNGTWFARDPWHGKSRYRGLCWESWAMDKDPESLGLCAIYEPHPTRQRPTDT